jgi:hypothetical protein
VPVAVAEAGSQAAKEAEEKVTVTQVVVVGLAVGRAVAAVNQAAPGSQPLMAFVMTNAEFSRWMTAQGK